MLIDIVTIFPLELFIQNCWKQSRARPQYDYYRIESDVFSQCGADPSSKGRGLDSLKGHVLASSSATSTPSCWQSCASSPRSKPLLPAQEGEGLPLHCRDGEGAPEEGSGQGYFCLLRPHLASSPKLRSSHSDPGLSQAVDEAVGGLRSLSKGS